LEGIAPPHEHPDASSASDAAASPCTPPPIFYDVVEVIVKTFLSQNFRKKVLEESSLSA